MFYEPIKDNHGLARPPYKSCVVPRAIGWISTVSKDGIDNLAPFSQFTNLSWDPPYVLLGFNRNASGRIKDTPLNIQETGEFVYNMATYELRDKLNITGAHFRPEVDEFEKAGLTKVPSNLIKPHRVAESPIHFECTYVQTINLPGNTPGSGMDVVIGKVVGVHIRDDVIMADGKIDIEKIKPLARLGYSDYSCVDRVFEIVSVSVTGEKNTHNLALEGGAKK